jgi:2-oxoisovalerate dehydrogenase E2 component (dihydrolipoyl transacylase)
MAERTFALPDLGEGLEDAVVTNWLVAEGAEVELNQPIAEIETAKAVVEMPSPFAGRIVRLHAAAGDTVAVGAPLVTFDVVAEESPSAPITSGSPSAASAARTTPAVRKLAKEIGVDLSVISGSGPEGRITREDVEAFARSGVTAHAYEQTLPDGEPVTAWTVSMNTDPEEVPITTIRRAIADHLTEVAAIPQVTTFRTVDCSALDDFRREIGTSPLPVFVRALAEICRDHRFLNATWADRAILLHRKVNVGVATDTERGLVVPVVRDVRSKGIGEIAAEVERHARAAREGGLKPTDTSGATIAVSNTGSYGSESGTPLLNPGHAVTFALGVLGPRALVVDGNVEVRPACTLSLTFDHRVLDGATVGRALGALVDLLESAEALQELPR